MTAARSSHLTLRNVPPRLATALRAESRRRGLSLNQTAIELLSVATGLGGGAPAANGLEKLAGTWTAEEADSFDAAVSAQRQVDPEMWR